MENVDEENTWKLKLDLDPYNQYWVVYSIYQGHAHAYAKTKKQNKLFPLAESTHDQRQSKNLFLLYATKSQVLESL